VVLGAIHKSRAVGKLTSGNWLRATGFGRGLIGNRASEWVDPGRVDPGTPILGRSPIGNHYKRADDWSFYQIGVSENGGSPKIKKPKQIKNIGRTNKPPTFLIARHFVQWSDDQNGLSCFRAFGPKQAEAVRTLHVR